MKLLLDTNVAIKLEDPEPVGPNAAAFAEGCERHQLTRFVADANYADIGRDQNRLRRERTLSKLEKFPRLHRVALPPESELIAIFGAINNAHDKCDVELLAILAAGAVDLLISEDSGLKKRAERAGLGSRVLDIDEALAWLRQSYEPQAIELPYIEDVPAYQIDLKDPFFDSLRDDYPAFPEWFREKCIKGHRPCWIVKLEGRLAGLVIRKEETAGHGDCTSKAERILKISTFKMSPDFQGEKFGEQLLKQVLWWANSNRMEVVYLTVFEKHGELIQLLERYGFRRTKSLDNGELVLEKHMTFGALPDTRKVLGAIPYAQLHYPRYYDGPDAGKFVVPIRPEFHARLFPEIADTVAPEQEQLKLFGPPVEGCSRIPGNTIRKVYICRANTTQLRPGDLIFFYAAKQADYVRSQSITSIGVVEAVEEAHNLEDLIRMTAKRSVYSIEQLTTQMDGRATPVKVIDFLLTSHITPHVALATLCADGIFLNHPPQTISRLPEERYQKLCNYLNGSLSNRKNRQ